LVLTKVDIVGEECANAWSAWLKNRYGNSGVQVVGVQSYEQVSYGEGQGMSFSSVDCLQLDFSLGSRTKYQPHMPSQLRDNLREALKIAHTALLEPPLKVKEDQEKLAKWRPLVRAEVNWEAITQENDNKEVSVPVEAKEEEVEAPIEADTTPHSSTDEDTPSKEYSEDRFLTVGLIGTRIVHFVSGSG
jgi:hypothetical protein